MQYHAELNRDEMCRFNAMHVHLVGLDLMVMNMSDEEDRSPLCTASVNLNRSQLAFSALAGNISNAEEAGTRSEKQEVSAVFTGLHFHL